MHLIKHLCKKKIGTTAATRKFKKSHKFSSNSGAESNAISVNIWNKTHSLGPNMTPQDTLSK